MTDINPIKDTGVIKRPVKLADDVKRYDAGAYEVRWIPDKSGYFLIRAVPEKSQIQVGICDYRDINNIKHLFYTTVEDDLRQQCKLEEGMMERAYKGGPVTRLYTAILKEGFVSRMDHMGYLGKELGRCWTALRLNFGYEQDGISL